MNVMCQLSDSSLSNFYSALLSAAGATSVTIIGSSNINTINIANFDAFLFSNVDSTSVANKAIEAFNAGKKIAFGAFSGSAIALSGLNLGSYVDASGKVVDQLATTELQPPYDSAQAALEIRYVSDYMSGYSGMPAGVIELNKSSTKVTSFIALKSAGFLADALFIGWLPYSASAASLSTSGENYAKAMFARWMQQPAINKTISGYVYDGAGNPLVRNLRLYRRDTGEKLLETTSGLNGHYVFTTTYVTETYVLCMGEDGKNSQIKDRIIAE